MAGVVPFSPTPGRKQWNIRDKKSSRRLRSQLAEEGCPESQLVLAKQLLEQKNNDNDNDNEENARLGVFWLIKASEQGNVEATNILKSCLESGEGITEHNYLDVKACLNTSQNEKLAKRAAHEMFLSLSAGQDFITTEQLRKRMGKIDVSEGVTVPKVSGDLSNGNNSLEVECNSSHNVLGWAANENTFEEKLTEEHLENAAVTYSRGELPLVQRILTLTDPRNREIQNINYVHGVLRYPIRTARQSYLKLLDSFSFIYNNQPLSFFPSSSLIQIILIVAFYPYISMDSMLIFIPLFIHFMTFFIMIFSTLQMLQTRTEYSKFRVWSRLFLSYDRDGSLNTDDAEFEYCKKNLRPFVVYFLSLLMNLAAYPFISEIWIPQSEFAVVAIVLTFTTLYFFNEKSTTNKFDFLMLISFAIYVLAKYPYETDGVVRQTWRFLDIELPSLHGYSLPCFASQILGSCVEFCLNFRLFFYFLIPPIFLKMASRENWKGTYKVLIPHCVTLSWWQIAILCCQGATLYGLIRSTLALVGLIVFLPILSIATIILPIVAALKHFTDVTVTPKTGVTTLLASIPVLLMYYIDKKRNVQSGTYLYKFQIFLAIISAIFLLCPYVNECLSDAAGDGDIAIKPSITWDQYSSLCRKTLWNKRTIADIQKECVHLQDVAVNWEGLVEDVRIVKITNNFMKIMDYLPNGLSSKLTCLYGEKYQENCTGLADEKSKLCLIMKQIKPKEKCHARSWDRYEMEIKVKLKSNTWNNAEFIISLEVDDSLRNFTLHLSVKDQIWFLGSLNHPETIGSDHLIVHVEEIGCISCEDKSLTSQKSNKGSFTSEKVIGQISNSFKTILNFIFYPIVIFR